MIAMSNLIEAQGVTVDEAIQLALNQLGVGRDSVEIKILHHPRKGFLGIGARRAKVQATVRQDALEDGAEFDMAEGRRNRRRRRRPPRHRRDSEKDGNERQSTTAGREQRGGDRRDNDRRGGENRRDQKRPDGREEGGRDAKADGNAEQRASGNRRGSRRGGRGGRGRGGRSQGETQGNEGNAQSSQAGQSGQGAESRQSGQASQASQGSPGGQANRGAPDGERSRRRRGGRGRDRDRGGRDQRRDSEQGAATASMRADQKPEQRDASLPTSEPVTSVVVDANVVPAASTAAQATAPEQRVEALPLTEVRERCEEIVGEILRLMGFEAKVSAECVDADDEVIVHVEADAEGLLIGRRGQTLDAFEHLVNRSVAAREASENRVVIDVGGYRDRRRESLLELAGRLKERAMREERRVQVSPMSPRDRKVFQDAFSDDEEVTTRALGTGFYRRVLIVPAGADEREPSGDAEVVESADPPVNEQAE